VFFRCIKGGEKGNSFLGGGGGDPSVRHYRHTIAVGKEKVVALCATKVCRGGDNRPRNC